MHGIRSSMGIRTTAAALALSGAFLGARQARRPAVVSRPTPGIFGSKLYQDGLEHGWHGSTIPADILSRYHKHFQEGYLAGCSEAKYQETYAAAAGSLEWVTR